MQRMHVRRFGLKLCLWGLACLVATRILGCCWFKDCRPPDAEVTIQLLLSAEDNLNPDAHGEMHAVWVYCGLYRDSMDFREMDAESIRRSATVQQAVLPGDTVEYSFQVTLGQLRQKRAVIGVFADFEEGEVHSLRPYAVVPVRYATKHDGELFFAWALYDKIVRFDYKQTHRGPER